MGEGDGRGFLEVSNGRVKDGQRGHVCVYSTPSTWDGSSTCNTIPRLTVHKAITQRGLLPDRMSLNNTVALVTCVNAVR